MKKLFAAFAVAALLSATLLFGSAFAFGDKTGLDDTFNELAAAGQDQTPGLFGQFKQKMGVRQVLNRIADRLNLTDDQKAQIRAIVQAEIPVVKPILLNGVAVHQQLQPLGKDGVYNQSEVTRLAALQANNARLLIIEKEKTEARIFAVLTAEQRAEAEKIRAEFEAKIRERIAEAMTQNF